MSTRPYDTQETDAAALPPMRAIQAFEAIVRRGSVAAAADELGVSSGAVSQQLRKIERELGTRLLERDGRSLTLTSWGRMYYEQVRTAFDELRRAQHRLHIARAKQGIVLSAPPPLALWLQRLLLEWSTSHGTVSLRLIGSEREPVLQDEGIDFRICYGADARRYERFSQLFCDAVVPVCSPEFLRRHPIKDAADILECPLIEIVWDSRHRPPPTWVDWAWSAGIAPPQHPARLTFSLASAAIDAAQDSGGFVLGQVSMIAEHVRRGRLVVPVDRRLNLPESYFLAWQRGTLERQRCADFRNALIAAGRRQQDLCTSALSFTPSATAT
ncbi:LysR family transcriptional regulator [Steroidobacter agaridevorans]|uniref:LysR family transcriptional regulator n=1 Tax=Steroidobacter agaridevorans TaxID=2695856 RepID=A0A829YFQ5_9GAMM|nr:LysR family transcriptional regulator [Steroidobacter agaridevorans]GFE82255.1 LysR family transcriptional regulator [Steroidobacter agaridevorans]GFE85357.1 LysR family transcriptional regulator [Steroidobacter agaridevorans]